MTPPPKPLPSWTAVDFRCEGEPQVPPQDTTKGVVEAFQADTLAALRGCKTKLSARGADAERYGLVK